MMRPFLLLFFAAGVLSCGKAPANGALQLKVSYSGFRPKCVKVVATDGEDPANTQPLELPVTTTTTSPLIVAVFRPAGWGETIQLGAFAYEATCAGIAVAEDLGTVVRFEKGVIRKRELALTATDADDDGFVSPNDKGTDCDDGNAQVYPGAPELCSGGADENCDGQVDEGCSCQTGTTQSCYSGAASTGNVGTCKRGTQTCVNSTWGPCAGQVIPMTEACDLQDNNCNGTADDNVPPQPCYTMAGTAGVGQCKSGGRACTGGQYTGACIGQVGPGQEICDNIDNNCDGAVDGMMPCFPFPNGAPGVGTCAAGTQLCVSGVAGACNGTVGPTAELCDNKDNDCNNVVDNGINVGASCTGALGCGGSVACEADGGTRCAATQLPSAWYLDDDEDLRGNPDAGVMSCASPGARYFSNSDDCDDGDPYTLPGAAELCDDKDNNCDGTNADLQMGGVCGVTTWTGRADTVGEWTTVVSPRANDVFIAGGTHRNGVRTGAFSLFTVTNNTCGAAAINWVSGAGVRGTNQLFLAGAEGQLASMVVGSTACALAPVSATGSVVGMVAFNSGANGTPQAFGATSGGQVFRFTPPSTLDPLPSITNVQVADLHGSSPTTLVAIGRKATSNLPYVGQFNGTAWVEATLPGGLNASNALVAVYMVNDRTGFAVGGNGGNSIVLRMQRGIWSVVPSPNGGFAPRGVLAFGANSLYVVDNGNVRRYGLNGWATLTTRGGTTLMDLDGASPADLWIVGSNNTVLHWHE
ncbi:MAG: putative metal-binding motif-containing protein [Myxococcaceae bacterium]